MEARRQDQLLKAMDDDRDGSSKHRKQEEFPNTISVGSLMEEAATPTARIDISGDWRHIYIYIYIILKSNLLRTPSPAC
jgi:hypothetical protein